MSKPSNITCRAAALLLLLSLACAGAARGQQQQPAYKVDETDYTRCDLSEMYVVNDLGGGIFKALAERPGAKAAVVVYSPLAGDARRYARGVRRWMSEARGVAPGRLVEVYGGYAAKRRLELWLVPPGAEPPPDAPTAARVGVTLFDDYGFWPGEACPDEREPALEIFAETLKRLPGWRGTVVVHPNVNTRAARAGAVDWDPEAMTRRQALRRAARERLYLIRQLGLAPARIRAVVGSPARYSQAQLWLVPPAAAAPAGFHYDFRCRAPAAPAARRRLRRPASSIYKFRHEKAASPFRAVLPRGAHAPGLAGVARAEGRRRREAAGGRAQGGREGRREGPVRRRARGRGAGRARLPRRALGRVARLLH
jgi:hypothetical protein